MALVALLIAIWLALVAWRRRQQQIPGWHLLAWLAGGGLLLSLGLLLIDFESQKVAARLATPLGLAWLVLFGVALDLLRQRRWSSGGLVGGAWMLLTLGGNCWLSAALLGGLERSVPPPLASQWDAVAVLGGGTAVDDAGNSQLGEAGDRLRVAYEQLRAGRTPLLVAMGSGLIGHDQSRDLAAETGRLWGRWGVPPPGMLLLPGPVNTSQEIALLAEQARSRGWRRIAIVSSGWHLPRALALARRHGLEADALPADHRGRLPPASPIFLLPHGRGFHETQLWSTEVIGRMVGR